MFTNFSLPAVLAIILLGIALYAFMPKGKYRILMMLGYILFSAFLVLGTGEILGLAKPVQLEWRDIKKARVIGMQFDEGVAIYIWVRDGKATRLYSLPWVIGGENDAEKMQDGWRKAAAHGDDFTFDKQPGESAHVKADGDSLPAKEEAPKYNPLGG